MRISHKNHLAILFIFFSGCVVLFCQGKPTPPRTTVLLPGEYLRADYIEKINKTRSPRAAAVAGSPQLMIITKSAGGLLFQMILNFNEGGPEFLLGADGSVKTMVDAGFNLSNLTVDILDSLHVRIASGSFPSSTFAHVNKAESFVAGRCLVGTYKDDTGNNFVFSNEGKTSFPDRSHTFKIGLFYYPADTLDNMKIDSIDYAFQWHQETLSIYAVSGGSLFPDGAIDSKPLVSLRRLP